MSYSDLIKGELELAAQVLNDFLSNSQNIQKIEDAADLMVQSFHNKGKVYRLADYVDEDLPA